MRVVVATAEPFGAYHLSALSREMRARDTVEFFHLIPYPTYTQGRSAATPVADLSILDGADRLVLSGGGLTAWTHAVSAYARQSGLPLLMMELAYGTTGRQPLAPDVCAAMSPAGAKVMAEAFAFPVEAIPVLGNPQLDEVVPWSANAVPSVNRPGPVLLVSTSELPTRDPAGTLRTLGHQLAREGYEVAVAPHPREDTSYWAGFTLTRVQETAHRCAVAMGYPGSVWAYLAAAGVPTVGVSSGSTLDGLPQAVVDAASFWVKSAEDFVPSRLARACPAAPDVVRELCGPVGGAASRVIDFFVS